MVGTTMEKGKMVEEAPSEKVPYPKSVFFIIGNEFCERFSYYGMRTILTLYLTSVLLYSDDNATVIYHVFSMACYFTPILGAILSDSFLGKFRTILYISIIYAIGNIVLSVAAVPSFLPMIPFSMLGLGLIALGTGGIKPCVSAFGGDQFGPGQELQLQRFFSLFYLAINAGSLISTFLTPILRADVSCLGEKTCYALAFGVPAALMVTSLILFVIGKPLYKVVAPTGNVVVKVSKCIGHAIVSKCRYKGPTKKENWLDYADDKYSKSFIDDVKAVLHVLLLYIPLPVFWALFDQQGSRWTLQATKMDGQLGRFRIKPDQMQVINPLLIIGFIPLFEYVVYPVLAKCQMLVKPLQRITVGGMLAASSFLVAGFVEIGLEKTLPVLPSAGYSQVQVMNLAPCALRVESAIKSFDLGLYKWEILKDVRSNYNHTLNFTAAPNCSLGENAIEPLSYDFSTKSTSVESVIVTILGNKIDVLRVRDSLAKPEKGESNVRIFYHLPKFSFNDYPNATFKLVGEAETYKLPWNVSRDEKGHFGATNYTRIDPSKYKLYLPINDTHHESTSVGPFEVKTGGGYVVTLIPNKNETLQPTLKMHTVVNANTYPMFWQIPQYTIITAGEIMFSITGLEFSYSQAPSTMKSVLQAAWLLTVAFGNVIVVLVAKFLDFKKRSDELFMFAGLMAVDMIIFAIMAYFYKYVGENEKDKKKLVSYGSTEDVSKKPEGISNAAFSNEDTKM